MATYAFLKIDLAQGGKYGYDPATSAFVDLTTLLDTYGALGYQVVVSHAGGDNIDFIILQRSSADIPGP